MRRALAALMLCAAVATAASAGSSEPGDPTDPAAIIGGTPTTVGQYPAVVALTVGSSLCTGTLIHREWVLTAAHCLVPAALQLPSQEAVTQSVRVYLGTVDVMASPGDVRRASLTIPKAAFSPARLGQHDIGLVKLSEPVAGIAPAPVSFLPARAPVGTAVTMVGFGATETGGGGTLGVQRVLEGRASISCAQYPGLSDADLLCFSQVDSLGKCRGDSGGPSFAMLDGRLTVVGVTSFGDPQCIQLSADTRTDAEERFVDEHIPELFICDGDEDCPDELCFDHHCIAPPFSPTGIGTACEADADCDSEVCHDGPGGAHCSEACALGAPGACPAGFDCLASPGGTGRCWPEGLDGGCCDASGRGAPTALLGLALVGLALRRRGRR